METIPWNTYKIENIIGLDQSEWSIFFFVKKWVFSFKIS